VAVVATVASVVTTIGVPASKATWEDRKSNKFSYNCRDLPSHMIETFIPKDHDKNSSDI
jgi:hypothetical protein